MPTSPILAYFDERFYGACADGELVIDDEGVELVCAVVKGELFYGSRRSNDPAKSLQV
jgi:hypothetical protein